MYATCLRYARDEHEARDFAQEAWIRAFRKLGGFRGEGPLEGWLRRLAANVCVSAVRRRRRVEPIDAETLGAAGHLEPGAIEALGAAELLRLVRALPEGYRLVFNLVAVEGYTHAEAAEALGITPSSSRSQLTRAREALRRRLTRTRALCL